jgi:hypothetical protein
MVSSAPKLLTCHQIGLDRKSHNAHKDVTSIQVAVPDPKFSQLWDRHRAISFQQLLAVETCLHDTALSMR